MHPGWKTKVVYSLRNLRIWRGFRVVEEIFVLALRSPLRILQPVGHSMKYFLTRLIFGAKSGLFSLQITVTTVHKVEKVAIVCMVVVLIIYSVPLCWKASSRTENELIYRHNMRNKIELNPLRKRFTFPSFRLPWLRLTLLELIQCTKK